MIRARVNKRGQGERREVVLKVQQAKKKMLIKRKLNLQDQIQEAIPAHRKEAKKNQHQKIKK